jgi:hypothetical protein
MRVQFSFDGCHAEMPESPLAQPIALRRGTYLFQVVKNFCWLVQRTRLFRLLAIGAHYIERLGEILCRE